MGTGSASEGRRLVVSSPRRHDRLNSGDFLRSSADPLAFHPLRFRERVTGKCVRSRYEAERGLIVARYGEWEIVHPPELRHSAARRSP